MIANPIKIDETVYRFGEIVLVARQWQGGLRASWVLVCPTCKQRRQVNRHGSKQWVATCEDCKAEYTIGPQEYYIMKECDFTRILGGL